MLFPMMVYLFIVIFLQVCFIGLQLYTSRSSSMTYVTGGVLSIIVLLSLESLFTIFCLYLIFKEEDSTKSKALFSDCDNPDQDRAGNSQSATVVHMKEFTRKIPIQEMI